MSYTIVDEENPMTYEKYGWKIDVSDNELCLAVKVYEKNGNTEHSPTAENMEYEIAAYFSNASDERDRINKYVASAQDVCGLSILKYVSYKLPKLTEPWGSYISFTGTMSEYWEGMVHARRSLEVINAGGDDSREDRSNFRGYVYFTEYMYNNKKFWPEDPVEVDLSDDDMVIFSGATGDILQNNIAQHVKSSISDFFSTANDPI